VPSLSSNDPNLLVLVSLAGGPRHGHAILLDVQSFAGVRLGPGTLYGAIGRLETDGLIAPMPLDGRRRPYRLTRRGRSALADRLNGLSVAVQTGIRRIEASS
jgi:DNA-binding PadR family transcriptional regulator